MLGISLKSEHLIWTSETINIFKGLVVIKQHNKCKNIMSVLSNIGTYDFFNQNCKDIISYHLIDRLQRNW